MKFIVLEDSDMDSQLINMIIGRAMRGSDISYSINNFDSIRDASEFIDNTSGPRILISDRTVNDGIATTFANACKDMGIYTITQTSSIIPSEIEAHRMAGNAFCSKHELHKQLPGAIEQGIEYLRENGELSAETDHNSESGNDFKNQ